MTWRKPGCGNLFTIVGEGCENFKDSYEWTATSQGRTLAKRVKQIADAQAASISGMDLPLQFPSVDAAASLLARLHTPGQTVLAAWDPLGVISAAAEKIGEDCVSFLGMRTNTSFSGVYPRETFPIVHSTKPPLAPDVKRFLYPSTKAGKVPTEVGGRSDSEVVPAAHPHTSAASGSKSLEAGGGSNSEAVPAARPNPSAVKRPKSPSASSKDRKGKKKARK